MGYVLTPSTSARREIRRVAAERLGDAIERLDSALGATDGGADAETTVHEVRKRCKEVRGLARLVRPALGEGFRPFDRTVRSAARELAALRDAHAVLATFDALVDVRRNSEDRHDLLVVRAGQEALADAATDAVGGGDERLRRARSLLEDALDASQQWRIPPGFDALGDGLGSTYQLGRRWLHRAERRPTDERLHEWRKAVKYLWYQARLLHDAAPSAMGPLVERLDALAEALGDDHDLAVLVARLGAADDPAVAHTVGIARAEQAELRRRAFRAGHAIYAEIDRAFVARVEQYWRDTVRRGPELAVGGIAALSEDGDAADRGGAPDGGSGRELERKFRVDVPVPDDVERRGATRIRQGYLAIDGDVSVRIRQAGECSLTVKWRTDRSGERGELEWTIPQEHFDAAWPATGERRITKTRHRFGVGAHTVEMDQFHDGLEGLVVAEVEFDSPEELAAFDPPAWFGDEVTDDPRYTNAELAEHGMPSP